MDICAADVRIAPGAARVLYIMSAAHDGRTAALCIPNTLCLLQSEQQQCFERQQIQLHRLLGE
jgi:hypothetical protein